MINNVKQVCSSFSELRPTSEISEISKIDDFFRSLFSTLFVKCTFATSPSIFGFLTQVKTKVVLHVLTPPQSPENFFLKNQTSGGFSASPGNSLEIVRERRRQPWSGIAAKVVEIMVVTLLAS